MGVEDFEFKASKERFDKFRRHSTLLETLKERDPNPARSSKVAQDIQKPVRHAISVTPANPATAGPSKSASNSADDYVFEGFEHPASPSSSSAHSVDVE
ncbi:hypothetical protein E2C01_051789 [Portunus trituberculatus]|uniref:Uncharacterized protein n=1 Tax=Portunus trituberculatus TaxID=210409 RepID=A0A5B7GCR1_PORTR|nr:hypothetical protein [Portunus trituberculatus]